MNAAAPGSALRASARAAYFTLKILALPACLLTTAAWFTSTPYPLAWLSPFRPLYASLLGGLVLFALAQRRAREAALFAFFSFANLAAVFGPMLGSRSTPAPPRDATTTPPSLKIVYANVLTANPDPSRLLALIDHEKPDLVALLEIDRRWRDILVRTISADYPHRFLHPREDNFGLAVFSRVEPRTGRIEYLADTDIPSFDFALEHPIGPLRVLLTHPLPPGDARGTKLRDQHLGELALWRSFVAGLARPATPAPAVLILGDLNATPWCPPLHRLLTTSELRPAAWDHKLLATTWPVPLPHLRVPLDHALLDSRLHCHSYRVGPDIGSDHYPLILELVRAAGP